MKSKTALLTICALFAACGWALSGDDDAAQYDNHGVQFRYPNKWTKSEKIKRTTTSITVKNKRGTTFNVQLSPPNLTPKLLIDTTQKQLAKIFKDKMTVSEKAPKRKLLGKVRKGRRIDLRVAATAVVTVELYAFRDAAAKKTVFVLFNRSNIDPAGERQLRQIEGTFKLSKK